MKHITRNVMIILIALIIFTGAGVYAFVNLGSWLVISDPLPDTADVIFTFGGDTARIVYALELSKRYRNAQYILPKSTLERMGKIEIDSSLIVLADFNYSTIEEVLYLKKYLEREKELKIKMQIILVSSPFHMRRISFMANREIEKKLKDRVVLWYAPVKPACLPEGELKYPRWWENKKLRDFVRSEVVKMFYYFALGKLEQRFNK